MTLPHPAPGWRACARREWAWLRANPWDLALISWLPLAVGLLVLWIFSAGVARDLPIVVIDEDHSALSRQLLRSLDASPGLRIAAQADRWDEALPLLRQRLAYGVVQVPAGTAHLIQTGQSAAVNVWVNGQFQAHAGALGRDVRAVVGTLSAGIELAAREKRGAAPAVARAQMEPIRLRSATVFNEAGSYEGFLVLALLPAVAQVFMTLAAVSAVGRELKAGSVADWLASAGGRWPAALAGKLLPALLAFALLEALFVAGLAARGWPVLGSLPMLGAGLAALLLAQIGLGLLLVGVTLNFRNALSGAAFLTAPAFAFCGQGFPLQAMPTLARGWAEALPLTHYLQLQTRHWLAGAPAAYGWGELAALALIAAVAGGLGAWRLAQRAADPAAWGRS